VSKKKREQKITEIKSQAGI